MTVSMQYRTRFNFFFILKTNYSCPTLGIFSLNEKYAGNLGAPTNRWGYAEIISFSEAGSFEK